MTEDSSSSSGVDLARKSGFRLRVVLAALLLLFCALCIVLLRGCTNDPWPSGFSSSDTYFTNYSSEFKTFDPAVSYYVHEGEVLDSIVEMPVCYDYLKRPYELVPMLAESVPVPVYYGKSGEVLTGDPPSDAVSRVEYLVRVRRGIKYQPHPCFGVSPDGKGAYAGVDSKSLKAYSSLSEFPVQGTREMTAVDFKVAVTRLCDTRLASPIYSTFASFILGMDECSSLIKAEVARLEQESQSCGIRLESYPVVPDYRTLPLAGFELIDDHTFKLVLSRKYPQAIYWMALHFFSPVPFEALEFYAEPGVVDAGYSFKNWPVGTGAYMMTECKLREGLTLVKNPNFRDEFYPSSGSESDKALGLLADSGKRLPFIERIRFQYERESIPIWIKFLQGYYDTSGIPSDMYDAAVTLETNGDMGLSPEMAAKGMAMTRSVTAISYYLGFNMLDPTVGGLTPEKKKLRQAISIAVDYQEFIDVFMNGRGVPGQSILPPGIYGCVEGEAGVNPFVDQWDAESGKTVRQPLARAKELMVEAGYPNGIGPDGKPLVLYYDASGSSSQSKATFLWLREKMSQLGIVLEERLTDLNRFRDKIRTGQWQLQFTGWVADYPDPENFLFLFCGENGIVATQGRGSNKTNYSSSEYDKVFKRLETMANGPERMALIDEAVKILQEDAPCCWGYHPMSLVLTHGWLKNYKPHHVGKTFMKNLRIESEARTEYQKRENAPVLWPGYLVVLLVLLVGSWRLYVWRS
ncbi:MAG: ABC transporter substrate-binding protein [Lentisphaerae bacterium]|jgi:ABC-type oligopeptide transport system substrate-binding subunit|nr:ABC transporter substrate-binding protein [Lentisphaerota bacterium]